MVIAKPVMNILAVVGVPSKYADRFRCSLSARADVSGQSVPSSIISSSSTNASTDLSSGSGKSAIMLINPETIADRKRITTNHRTEFNPAPNVYKCNANAAPPRRATC
jgi:hypothetical protein